MLISFFLTLSLGTCFLFTNIVLLATRRHQYEQELLQGRGGDGEEGEEGEDGEEEEERESFRFFVFLFFCFFCPIYRPSD